MDSGPKPRLFIGTAGYSYADWVGPIYPPGTKTAGYLPHYARLFPLGELNFSYYRMPTAHALAAIHDKAPNVQWCVKAHQSMTHDRSAGLTEFLQFRESLEPLLAPSRLFACLFQFPTSFHRSPVALDWLRQCREWLPDLPVVVEFRGRDWIDTEAVLPLLRELDLAWCAVDEPDLPALMPPLAAATASLGYIRFHGRNAAKWWKHDHAYERYDYLYTAAELADWIPRIARLLEKTGTVGVVFNNHYRGQSVENARMLAELLPAELHQHLVAPSTME
ncbi:MAG: DUF72 domain-containing protein, partial [bacterium]